MVTLEDMAREIRANADNFRQIRGYPFLPASLRSGEKLEVCILGMLTGIYCPEQVQYIQDYRKDHPEINGMEETERVVALLAEAGLPVYDTVCYEAAWGGIVSRPLWELMYRANDGLLFIRREEDSQKMTFIEIADMLEQVKPC